MIILDTSIWIEFFKQNPDFASNVEILLEEKKVLGLQCIFGELLQGARNDQEIDIIISYWENLPKCNEDNIWIKAGIYSSKNKLPSKGIGIIDSIIAIAIRQNNAKLWTLDKKLKNNLKKEEIYNP